MAYSSDPSERAKQLHAEGRFGGRQPGAGRPRVRRATEIAAEAAVEHADQIVAGLRAALDESEPAEVRSRGAARWLELIIREGTLAQRERAQDRADRFELMSHDELAELSAQAIVEMIAAGEIHAAELVNLAPTIDAEPADVSTPGLTVNVLT